MAILKNLVKSFDSLWPKDSAESWDRPGLMVGSLDAEVSKVLLSVDITTAVMSEAIAQDCQLVLAHHPMLLRPVHELGGQTGKGALVHKAIKSDLAVFAAHTNADIAAGGVSESLALALGLSSLRPLDGLTGHGHVGEVHETSLLDFARMVAKAVPATAAGIKVAGDPDRRISRVALVAGAGDGFLPQALCSGVDVFITSDLRHHPAQDFLEAAAASGGPSLIDIPHWAAEWPWLTSAAAQLHRLHPDVEWVVSDLRTDPWDFTVVQ